MVLVNRRIYIEPGNANYVVQASVTVPRDVELVGITPHAHYLATDMKVDAHLPDGTHDAADLDQGLGLQLAGAVPLREAGAPSQRHPRGHAVRLRQLGEEPAESVQPADDGDMGGRDNQRDGDCLSRVRPSLAGRCPGFPTGRR